MKYPIILKYTYSYIISGNNNKEDVREYYQLFTDKNTSEIFCLDNSIRENKVDIIEYNGEEISFTYAYLRYSKPNTFNHDTELITKSYTLKKSEKINCESVEMYWAYAKGGENGIATLSVEWITYEELMHKCLDMVAKDPDLAENMASFLIKEASYDLAYKILVESGIKSYHLGLCYEKGYGTKIDITKALDIYLTVSGRDAEAGIERIINTPKYKRIISNELNKTLKYDDIKKTILLEKLGRYKEAYASATIPREISDNTLEDMRRNVELDVIWFLELGRPHNDPFGRPTHNMRYLAEYYDMINNVPQRERKVYFETWDEPDPYDGGSFIRESFNKNAIIETLQKETLKNDVIALGCLAVQFAIDPQDSSFKMDNIDDILKRLIYIAENGSQNDSGMAYYFLGRYYENEVCLKELLLREYNEENMIIAKKYFKLALEKDFHMAIAHLFTDVVEENSKEETLKILEVHEKYVPYIRWSNAEKYHKMLEELRK